MKKSILIFSVFILVTLTSFSQYKIKPDYYVIYFKDKQGTNYTTDKPQEFLSAKSLERRGKFNISITSEDLPVSKKYIDILKAKGFVVKEVSKWLNCAVVYSTDSVLVSQVSQWDFVRTKPDYKNNDYKQVKIKQSKIKQKSVSEDLKNKYNYGLAQTQTDMLDLIKLHNLGFDGKGVTIAILDAGFQKVNKLPAFDSLWHNDQILTWYDFVDNDTNVFDVGTHGMNVLSLIGGNTDNFVGTAPKASFYLFRTEDEYTEYPIEEFNYVCACEKADSLGVDLIHSSLGYNDFNDKLMNYTYADMDGNTAISSIAADIAASKGIMVISSAGNEGANSWKYISAPADADSVLAIGAVNFKAKYAIFSSVGPTNDGRVKPNVVAMGQSVALEGINGNITYGSGTSFSGPIISGSVACLIQAFPDVSNMNLIYAIESCASQAKKPETKLGYGIPDFYLTYLYLNKKYKK